MHIIESGEHLSFVATGTPSSQHSYRNSTVLNPHSLLPSGICMMVDLAFE